MAQGKQKQNQQCSAHEQVHTTGGLHVFARAGADGRAADQALVAEPAYLIAQRLRGQGPMAEQPTKPLWQSLLHLVAKRLHRQEPVAKQPTKPLWQSLLDLAANKKMDAFIDCGALLAGVSGR